MIRALTRQSDVIQSTLRVGQAAANHAVLSNDLWHKDLENMGNAGEVARRAVGERILALKKREFNTLGTVLGLCIENSPIIESEGTPPSTHDSQHYIPSNRPGCLAPHVWRGEKLSLYDEFGGGFTLICAPGAAPSEIRKAEAEASELNISLAVISLAASEALGRYTTPLTLVRPDQYVAWRGWSWKTNMLRKATGWNDVTPNASRFTNE